MSGADKTTDGFRVSDLGLEVRRKIYSPSLGFGAATGSYD